MLEFESPYISVILPVYNVAPYIVECLGSIIGQTFQDFELLVIDDVSTDNSMEVVHHFLNSVNSHSNIRIIKHEKNSGLSAARNTGIEAAKGNYLVFIDSDDWVAKDMLEHFVRESENHPMSVICGNSVQVLDGVQSPYWSTDERMILDKNEAIKRMLIYDKVIDTAWAKMTPRSLFMKYNIRFPEGSYFEDTPTNMRIFNRADKVVVITENVYYYRRNRAGSILQEKSFRSVNDRLAVFDYIYNYLLNETSIEKEFTLNYYLNRMTFEYRMVINGYNLNVSQQQKVLNSISKVVENLREKYGNQTLKKKIGTKFNFLMHHAIYKSAFVFLLLNNTFYSVLRFVVEDI